MHPSTTRALGKCTCALTLALVAQAGFPALVGYNPIYTGECTRDASAEPPPPPGNGISNGIILGKLMTGLGPCDISFSVREFAAGEAAGFRFRLFEGVRNDTGLDWRDFHHNLLITSAGDSVSFISSAADPPMASNFTLTGQSADSLDWIGFLPSLPAAINLELFRFDLNVIDANNDNAVTFTLRQRATVSEPGSLSLLLVLGAAAALARRRSRPVRLDGASRSPER